ncbi:perilipin-2-like [Rhinatrema bivittatum]|uniref:perilipin-2-like n=1 Tax=Rhinatrema bivittatum TaxID=194408 RepID=UPI00112A8E87|nr:perilipin-2-like [Rhinatrema bivittatum]
MASEAAGPQQSVVVRVANLPLVSSTCDLVSSAYISTKENHPYLKSVCEVAEKGAKTITAVAVTSANPIIQKLEPQIACANKCACKGLDKIEKKLPLLLQQPDKLVAGAKEAVTGTVTGAKDTVAHAITGVVDKTKGAAQESMEMTKAVVTGSINSVMGSRMVQVVSTGVDAALTKSEALVDHYLPLTEGEQAKEAIGGEGLAAGTQKPNYYVRLGSLSSKIRRQAYEQALSRMKDAKHSSQEAISHLYHTIDLHAESRALAIAQDLARQLQTNCLTLVSSIQDLPQNIQNKVHHISCLAGDLYQNLQSVASFSDLSDQLLVTSKGQLKKMKETLDEVMDYLVNNTPLNRLLGPVCPQPKQEEQASQQESEHKSS